LLTTKTKGNASGIDELNSSFDSVSLNIIPSYQKEIKQRRNKMNETGKTTSETFITYGYWT